MRNYRSLTAATLAIVLSALAGGVFGHSALATEDSIPDHYKTFTAALSVIQANYAEPVESDRLVYGAINGMLQTLDPHSSFMDPRTYAQMRERQEGRYYGLGLTIVALDGDITVVRVFEGSPAYIQGIRRGDVIARIESDDAKGWTSEQAVRRLKGPKGTFVNIGLRRKGLDDLIPLAVMRDEITIPAVTAHFMVDPQTGYVRIDDFAEHTEEELTEALQGMQAKGMKRLVLDLRNNPGGQLDQAIRMVNLFIKRGSMIVYTRGRVPNSDQDYRATADGDFQQMPMIVMVNRNSASASEIVSGALQDYDRALVIGETTFGKALVQSVYRVSQGAGLALTTACYFTPSGRMIQRPWDGSFDEYLTYTLKDQADRPHTADQLKYTVGGRKVYSGGGIEPDRRFDGPVEGFTPTLFGRSLYARQLFASYAEQFTAEGDTRAGAQGKSRKVVGPGFVVDAAMEQDFKQFVIGRKMPIDEAAWSKDVAFIRAMIRYDIDVALFSAATARQRLMADDPQAQYALGLFAEAAKLLELPKTNTAKVGQ
ncbi:MAG: S41 family peptidase [Acidobacteria bacterium]|nr:S41 family peptidase [Acidobacteriota bacterium]